MVAYHVLYKLGETELDCIRIEIACLSFKTSINSRATGVLPALNTLIYTSKTIIRYLLPPPSYI
jgi:hypothetical protein